MQIKFTCSNAVLQQLLREYAPEPINDKWRCFIVGSELAFESIGHGFESEHRLFSHYNASAFIKLGLLPKYSLDDLVYQLL